MATKTVRLAAATGSRILERGDARLESFWKGEKCNVKVLGADVKILLASVSVIFEEGNIVMFGQQDSHVENTSTC